MQSFAKISSQIPTRLTLRFLILLSIFVSTPSFAQKSCSALFSTHEKTAPATKVTFETRLKKANTKLRKFHPEIPTHETKLRPEDIVWDSAPKDAERGADGEVRFGTYKGQPIVVKFYYALSLKAQFPDAPPEVVQKAISNFVNQSVAVMDAVHTLGYGPKPYGFAVENQAAHWFESANINTTPYSAVVIMERIQPEYHKKSRYVQKHIEPTPEMKAQIEQATTAFLDIGLTIMDMDFMIANKRLKFIDFDKWLIAKEDGFWWMGQYRPDPPKHRDFHQEITEILFEKSED